MNWGGRRLVALVAAALAGCGARGVTSEEVEAPKGRPAPPPPPIVVEGEVLRREVVVDPMYARPVEGGGTEVFAWLRNVSGRALSLQVRAVGYDRSSAVVRVKGGGAWQACGLEPGEEREFHEVLADRRATRASVEVREVGQPVADGPSARGGAGDGTGAVGAAVDLVPRVAPLRPKPPGG